MGGRKQERIGDAKAQKRLKGGLTDKEVEHIERAAQFRDEITTKDHDGKGRAGRDPRRIRKGRRVYTEEEYTELKRKGLL